MMLSSNAAVATHTERQLTLFNAGLLMRRELPQPARPIPPRFVQRFEDKVDRSGGANACHLWTASTRPSDGYGQFSDKLPGAARRTMRHAHRVAWEMANGRYLRSDERILHGPGCSKLCCNPRHLRVGTAAENTADAKAEGRLVGAKLDEDTARTIAALRHTQGLRIAELATRFGVSHQTIDSVVKGKTWGWATGIQNVPRKAGRPPRAAAPERALAA